MTEFTPARLAELKAVAEAATVPEHFVCDCYVQCGDEVCPNTKPIFKTHDNDTVLALIAALEAETAMVDWLREIGQGLLNQRDEARAEVDELRAWQARTVRRVRDSVGSEHYTMLVVEDIPNADFGELIDKIRRERDEARAALERVREAATEVTNQENNHGRTHYENCWKQHLNCLAAMIIHETGEDDE